MRLRRPPYPAEVWNLIGMALVALLAGTGAFFFGDHEDFMQKQAKRMSAKKQEALRNPVLPASYEYRL